ncbi:hypothetical protein [Aquitalea palustris]|nr:hypothetical protein [Aquitalea palustris]
MTIHAFKDANDGYYQVDVPDGEDMPEWTEGLTPCAVQPATSNTAQQLASLQQGVQHWLDTTAQANGYDGIASCCSYYNSSVAQYAADAKAATLWRDAVWQACYAQSAALSSQPNPVIPTLATLLLSLPQPATYGWTAHAPGA